MLGRVVSPEQRRPCPMRVAGAKFGRYGAAVAFVTHEQPSHRMAVDPRSAFTSRHITCAVGCLPPASLAADIGGCCHPRPALVRRITVRFSPGHEPQGIRRRNRTPAASWK